MLAGLSDLTSDPRPEVRSCALEVLFDLLDERGSKFSSSFWESIFHRVLFPIFDHVRHAGREGISSDDELLRETNIHSLQLLCNLFNTFYKEVCFMLPPLLSLLLDCAKQTDQSVVSLSLGALVHLIEVGGHQFSESDWDMLLKSIRDASYTTQPLELLNDLGFDSAFNYDEVDGQFEIRDNGKVSPFPFSNTGPDGTAGNPNSAVPMDHSRESGSHINLEGSVNLEGSEGIPSPSGRADKPADAGGLQRNQTIGQRIMGNMMDNLFLRNLTSKSKNRVSDDYVPSSPVQLPDAVEPDDKDEVESPLLGTVRGKCITQLLLLGAIDSIQKKYWSKLKAPQKIAVMDILLSLLEFAASYNSYANLRLRMHQNTDERPPLNLLRQELAALCIYLDILLKATSGYDANKERDLNSSQDVDTTPGNNSTPEEKLERTAEEKLVSLCEQVLKEASDLQTSVGETTNMDIHRVLELRSPIIVKVLKSMCFMNNQIFKRNLRDFYPLLTKLVCCDQMDVRGALGDLFKAQLKALLP